MPTPNKINMHPHTSGQLRTLIGRTVFQTFSAVVGGEGDSHQPVQLNTSVSIFQAGQPKETTNRSVCTMYIHMYMCVHMCVHDMYIYVCKSVHMYIIMSIVHTYVRAPVNLCMCT